jgi:outer membrane protein TolC
MMRKFAFSAVAGVLQLSMAMSSAAQSLPDPLTLEHAMQFADDAEAYVLIEAQSGIELSRSELQRAESALGFRAQLELEAAYIEPSEITYDQSSNDSSATLRLSKPIYDFGGSQKKIEAASLEQQALQANLPYVIAQRKLSIARDFFEVILADLKYVWDNEALAIAYVSYDSVQDRHALNQVSDLELMASETAYLETLHARNISEAQQRQSRAILAETLNRPSQLPTNLQRPSLSFVNQPLPEYTEVMQKVEQSNPYIKLAETRLLAAQQRVDAEDKQMRPLLSAEVAVSEYAREKTSDDLRATLNLVVPLYESRSIKSAVARARSAWMKQRAETLNIKIQVRQQALQLWQRINVLQKRYQQLLSTQAFRELSLDKSRALYEMEVKTDLGDSMVAISETQYKRAKNEFELVLAWMQLQLLMGETDLVFGDHNE